MVPSPMRYITAKEKIQVPEKTELETGLLSLWRQHPES
jgi:hypothetical protein